MNSRYGRSIHNNRKNKTALKLSIETAMNGFAIDLATTNNHA
ncbi:hypothetical protein [Nitrosomonas sp.]